MRSCGWGKKTKWSSYATGSYMRHALPRLISACYLRWLGYQCGTWFMAGGAGWRPGLSQSRGRGAPGPRAGAPPRTRQCAVAGPPSGARPRWPGRPRSWLQGQGGTPGCRSGRCGARAGGAGWETGRHVRQHAGGTARCAGWRGGSPRSRRAFTSSSFHRRHCRFCRQGERGAGWGGSGRGHPHFICHNSRHPQVPTGAHLHPLKIRHRHPAAVGLQQSREGRGHARGQRVHLPRPPRPPPQLPTAGQPCPKHWWQLT